MKYQEKSNIKEVAGQRPWPLKNTDKLIKKFNRLTEDLFEGNNGVQKETVVFAHMAISSNTLAEEDFLQVALNRRSFYKYEEDLQYL